MTQHLLPPATVAFLGLGTMGQPMALHLIRHGYRISVFDTYRAALDRFRDMDCRLAASPSDAARDAAVVITMLPNASDVRAALLGPDGACSTLPKGGLVIDMSTIDAGESKILAQELQGLGLRMIDAPVARSPEHAKRGELLVLAGGDAADVEAARPILDCFAESVYHIGGHGAGIQLKLINNYMSMVGMVLVAEGLTMAAKAGIDRAQAVEILSQTPAGKGQLTTNYVRKVLAGDITPDFPLRMGLKDISLGLALGANLSSPLPLGAAAREVFSLAKAWGRSEQDCTAVLHLLEDIARAETTVAA